MESLFFLVPLSLALVATAAYLFLRAVDGNQFEDLDQHGMDILDTTEDGDDPART